MRLSRGATVVLGMIAAVLLSGLAAPWARAQSLAQSRISAAIRSDQMQVMKGTVHPLVAVAQDQGQLSGSTPIQNMSLIFRPSAAQEADLKNLLQEQQTKGSSLYHQWLQPGQFAARYGVNQQDLTKVAAWLKSQGFTVNDIPASADRIDFSGTAAQVDATFHTEMHRYLMHGQQGWANSTEISLPQAIAGMALGVVHLSTFRPLPHVVKRAVSATPHGAAGAANPQYTLSCSTPGQNGCPASGLENYITPSDSQAIYDVTGLYNNDITGAGQTMAVVGQTDIVQYQNDISHFRSLSGLNASNLPTQILVTTPNTGPAAVSVPDLLEADIDTEWSGAIAKDATILYVTVGSNLNYSVFDSLIYAIQNKLINGGTQFVPVISISYGGCEQQNFSYSYIQYLETYLQEASAQGQTIVASSGDDGSADCDDTDSSPVPANKGLGVDYPASSQYVTGAGGTSFSGDLTNQATYWNGTNTTNNGSAISYIPETVWNNTPTQTLLSSTGSLSASGGGESQLFTKPSWQVGLNVPADGKRDVPDISLAADPNHDGYVLCTEQTNSAGTAFTTNPGTSSCATGNVTAYFGANYNFVYGGTSIAAPQLAAMITLWNQEAGNTAGVGNANPILYQSAQTTPGAFHDTITGSNAVVCQQGSPNCVSNGAGGYVMSCCAAGSGYDEATGLGSVDAAAMGGIWPRLTQVNGSFSLLLKPATVTVNPGASASTQLVLSPSGAGTGTSGFSGTVNLTCTNLPAGVSCSFAPGSSVALSPGTAQTLTVTISATSSAAAFSIARRSSPAPFHPGSPLRTAFAGILGLALLGAGRKRRYFPSRWMGVLLMAVGLMAATALTACGGSGGSSTTGGPPPPVTQTVTVTGTSGSTVASAQIELTVT